LSLAIYLALPRLWITFTRPQARLSLFKRFLIVPIISS
jgi:hypothetical protein